MNMVTYEAAVIHLHIAIKVILGVVPNTLRAA
jgi:hypothetical protein